jgi:hypothetical protein
MSSSFMKAPIETLLVARVESLDRRMASLKLGWAQNATSR